MRLALYVALERAVLLRRWEERACEYPPARQLSAEALREPVDALLVGVVAELQHASAAAANLEAARRALDAAGHDHAHQRLRAQFTVEQIVNEYVLLRGVVLRGWLVDGSRLDAPSGEDLTNFNAALDRLVVAAITTGLAEFDRARELLIGTLGHDLRNPLGALASNASLLARLLPKHAPAMDAVLRIERNTARMGRLIALLLDRTRLRLGAGLQVERKLMDTGRPVGSPLRNFSRCIRIARSSSAPAAT